MSFGEEQLLLNGEGLAGQQEWETAGVMVRDMRQLDFDTKRDSASIF